MCSSRRDANRRPPFEPFGWTPPPVRAPAGSSTSSGRTGSEKRVCIRAGVQEYPFSCLVRNNHGGTTSLVTSTQIPNASASESARYPCGPFRCMWRDSIFQLRCEEPAGLRNLSTLAGTCGDSGTILAFPSSPSSCLRRQHRYRRAFHHAGRTHPFLTPTSNSFPLQFDTARDDRTIPFIYGARHTAAAAGVPPLAPNRHMQTTADASSDTPVGGTRSVASRHSPLPGKIFLPSHTFARNALPSPFAGRGMNGDAVGTGEGSVWTRSCRTRREREAPLYVCRNRLDRTICG
ncbi:hypothetical protein C8F01DRAFT_508683 [Mycena amicta]|nr:hypothetical protein C8F01DRAFT_508683 [Mycena amicta]